MDKITGVYVQDSDGTMTNIVDLKKQDYEEFLATMEKLILAYNMITNKGVE